MRTRVGQYASVQPLSTQASVFGKQEIASTTARVRGAVHLFRVARLQKLIEYST
jgi:hypothetical protein